MSYQALLIFIVVVTTIVVGGVFIACFVFMRFMRREKERGDRFSDIHRKPPDL